MNKTYLKHLLKRNKKLIIIQFIIVIALYCYSALVNYPIYNGYSTNAYGLFSLFGIGDGIKIYLYGCVIIYPIYLNLKNYKQNGNDFLLSLPINKEKRYLNELVFSWLLIFIPYLIWVFINYLVPNHSVMENNELNVLFRYLIIILPISTLYLLNSLISVKSNNLMDAIILVATLNLTLYFLSSIVESFIDSNSFGGSISSIHYDKEITGLGYYSYSLVTVALSFCFPYESVRSLLSCTMNNFIFVHIVLYCIYSVILLFLNLIIYKNKRSEEYGGQTVSKLGYPLIISIMTCGLMLFTGIHLYSSVIIFCIYMGSYFLAERKISFSFRKILVFAGIVLFILSLRTLYVGTKGFGSYESYQKLDTINRIHVYFSGNGREVLELNMEDLSEFKQDEQVKIKKELEKTQNKLIEDYCNKNLWWKTNSTNDVIFMNISYYQDEERYNYYYKVDLMTRDNIINHLNALGFVENTYD